MPILAIDIWKQLPIKEEFNLGNVVFSKDNTTNNILRGATVIDNLTTSEITPTEGILISDFIAHSLHQISKKSNPRRWPVLDELADISKDFGEIDRTDRLLILADQSNDINRLNNLQVITKSLDDGNRYWKMMTKAIKNGVNALSDDEVVVLREWVYSRI
jgi:hypothetical protein